MDALDALFCFGFEIVRGGVLDKAQYKLNDKCSDIKDGDSVKLLLKEIGENAEYYSKEMKKRGDKM